jgi:hypothetical protein
MGESRATYEHADQVARLSEAIRRDHPVALQWALDHVPELRAAAGRLSKSDAPGAMSVFVAAQHCLATGYLAHLPDPHTAANDVLTAALWESSDIDYAATSVVVTRHPTGYMAGLDDGTTGHHVPVRWPADATRAARAIAVQSSTPIPHQPRPTAPARSRPRDPGPHQEGTRRAR